MRRITNPGARPLASAVALLALAGSAVAATTRTVDNTDADPNNDSIQAAIAASQPGDTVLVIGGGGPYAQSIVVDVPNLRLRGRFAPELVARNPTVPVVRITADGVRLKDLRIRGGSVGILADDGADGVDHVRIEDSEVHGNAEDGIRIVGDGSKVDDNDVHHNGDAGIELGRAGASSTGNEIDDNALHDNGGDGVDVTLGTGNEVQDNDAWNNAGTGFRGNDGDEYEENEAVTNGLDGFDVGASNELEDNEAATNGRHGFRIRGDFNAVEDNEALGNLAQGFELELAADTNALEDNEAEWNQGGFRLAGDFNDLEDNEGEESTQDGFHVAVGSTGNRFEDNEAEWNGDEGFEDLTSGTGTAGTANSYDDDECTANPTNSSPPGLCH